MFFHKEIAKNPIPGDPKKVVNRETVRAIIHKDGKLLMTFSPSKEDFRFPGSGIYLGESQRESLLSKLVQTCGIRPSQVNSKIGIITEYHYDEKNETLHTVTSHYYHCEIEESQGPALNSYQVKKMIITPNGSPSPQRFRRTRLP
jgi:8-oxo-dGTP diphosphatase